MITRIRIRNFKSLYDVNVDLGPFTVLIGQNGAGKSSFLRAIQVLSWLVRYSSINDALKEHGLTYNELVHLRAATSKISWEVALRAKAPDTSCPAVDAHLDVSLSKRRHVYVTEEWVHPPNGRNADGPFFVGRQGRTIMMAKEGNQTITYQNVSLAHSILLDAAAKRQEFPILSSIADELAGYLHYEIWGPESLREPSKGSTNVLAEHGENLPSVLHTLRKRKPDGLDALVSEVRKSYQWLDSIEIRRLGGTKYSLNFLEHRHDKRRRRIRYEPSQVSDGFLRLLALATLKYQSEKTSIVGYEEPENGMHPSMLQESVSRLRDLVKKGIQVIVTTHSPFLLQHLLSEDSGGNPADELRLVWRGKDGRTSIRPPKKDLLDRAKEQGIGSGELWSMLLEESEMAEPVTAAGGNST